MRPRDAIVVGGGPAGLAFAASAAERGLDVLVLERRALPADKACGEGLLPSAVSALARLGALERLGPADACPFRAVRWVQEDGSYAEAELPGGGGLGVRRPALSDALLRRALAAGAEVRDGCAVLDHRRGPDDVQVATDAGLARARVLVAADGLASPVRRRERLELPPSGPRRFGLRRHFARDPWSDAVEVHFGEGIEAYVTPVGGGLVGVAFLYEAGQGASFGELVKRFPWLARRLEGAEPVSRPAGAGPLARRSRARVLDRLVLLGDAAGYVDAITGEGLSIALDCAEALAAILPEALARDARREALLPYERGFAPRFRRYAAVTRLVLRLAERPSLRRRAIPFLAAHPDLFGRLVGWAVGTGRPPPALLRVAAENGGPRQGDGDPEAERL